MSIQNDSIYTSKAKDVVLHFLQSAFSSPRLFGEDDNKYLYSEDEKSSRIMIADYNTENLNSVNIKPAILVARGQITPRPIGLGDKTKQTFLSGYEQREVILNIGMSANCYAREGLEAEFLAVCVFKMFRFMNEVIQKRYDVFDISAQGVASEQKVRDGIVMVPTLLNISIVDAVKINFEEIQLNLLSVGNYGTFQTEVPGQ